MCETETEERESVGGGGAEEGNVIFLVSSAPKVLFLFDTFSYGSISPFLQSVLVLYHCRQGKESLEGFIGPGCSAPLPSDFSAFPGSSQSILLSLLFLTPPLGSDRPTLPCPKT